MSAQCCSSVNRPSPMPACGQRLLEPFLQRPLGTDNCLCAEEYDSPFFRSCLSYVERHPQRQSPDQLFSTLLPALLAELCESYARRQAAKPAQADGAARPPHGCGISSPMSMSACWMS